MQTDSGPADHCDIAIVGGGMVGAALAALLARANPRWSIVLLEAFALPTQGERAWQPSFDDRSTAIAHGSVTLLQQLGLWSRLADYATPIEQVHVSDRGHLGGTLIDRHSAGVEALGYVVPNAWIGRLLLAHLRTLPNVCLRAPAQVTALRPVAGGAELQVNEGCDAPDRAAPQTLACQLAVIADGAQSGLRASLGIEVRQRDYRQTAIIANIGLQQPHGGVAYERFTDEGPLAMLPLGGSPAGRESALVWTQPGAQAEALLALPDEDFLQRLQARFGYRLGPLVRVGRRDSYPLSLSVATEQVRSSLVVMGNAAHFLHPVAGQGFNLALRDCAALAETLSEAGDSQPLGKLTLLQSYLQRQQADQSLTIGFSDQLARWFSSSALPPAALRALGFIGLECLPPARQWLARQTMGAAGGQAHLSAHQSQPPAAHRSV